MLFAPGNILRSACDSECGIPDYNNTVEIERLRWKPEAKMQDGILQRLYRKSLGNQVAIAVSSSCSRDDFSIPALAEKIISHFKVDFSIGHRLQFFQKWNEFVEKAEQVADRYSLTTFVREIVGYAEPHETHHKVAAIPISNFIDTTFDRSLYKAMLSAGRNPILHDWNQSQMMGSWKQSNPENPNVFFMLPSVADEHSFFGIYEPASWWKQNRIQIENMREMLTEKDLILLDYSAFEAEGVLHLYSLDTACEKIVNFTNEVSNSSYWAARGTCVREGGPKTLIDRLLPHEKGHYSLWDKLIPSRYLIDVARDKEYDCFISYFSGDKDFVVKLEQDLRLRGIHTWRDDREVEIGDSISDKIQQGLSQSYSFMIVLSPEALLRPWVKEELRAAYALRLAGEFRILPILHKECELPPFLFDYKYADFRDDRRYHEQISSLERSIKNAVRKAREKK